MASRAVKLAGTVGFPNIGLQGFAPKLAKREIAPLSGAQDDARGISRSACRCSRVLADGYFAEV